MRHPSGQRRQASDCPRGVLCDGDQWRDAPLSAASFGVHERVFSALKAGCGDPARAQHDAVVARAREVRLIIVVIVGSLLAVALWEFCRLRRHREFPALRRRFGNLSIWLLNIVLGSFIFSPADTFRPQLEAALAWLCPPGRSPINGRALWWLSCCSIFALRRASLPACGAVPVALSRAA